MPAQNGTGPNGQGPLTGGGFGTCSTVKDHPIRRDAINGRRFLRRGGGNRRDRIGRSRRYDFFAGRGFADYLPTKEDEVNYLKSQASRLETALKDVQNLINDLDKSE